MTYQCLSAVIYICSYFSEYVHEIISVSNLLKGGRINFSSQKADPAEFFISGALYH